MSIYKYIITRQTLFTTQKHCMFNDVQRDAFQRHLPGRSEDEMITISIVNEAHMVLPSKESFFNHRIIKLATRFGTKCPQWELQLMIQLN